MGKDPNPVLEEWGLKSLQTVSAPVKKLLQLNFGTSLDELLLEVFSFVFSQAFFDSFWSTINCIFRFFQAKTSQFFYQLHNCKFVSTSCFQYNIEVGFLSSSSSTASSRTSCYSNRCSCRLNAICFFQIRSKFVYFFYSKFY